MRNQRRKTKKHQNPDKPILFHEHIAEFRRNLIIGTISILFASICSYFFHKELIKFFLKPLGDQHLYYDTPLGGMSFTFEMSLMTGLIISSPIWLFQIWSFIKPAIPIYWQKKIWIWVIVSSFLLLLGAIYGYFVSLPAALLVSKYFQSDELLPLISASEYFKFVIHYIISFSLFFQIPLIIFFCFLAGFVSSKQLLNFQRHVFLFCTIIGAIVTPTPDFINQLALTIPLFLLYELGVSMVIFQEKIKKFL